MNFNSCKPRGHSSSISLCFLENVCLPRKDLKVWSRVDPSEVLLQPRDTFQNKGSLVYKQLRADWGQSWWHWHPLLPMLLTGCVTLSQSIAFLNGNFLIYLGLPSQRSQEAWKAYTRHLEQGLAFTKHWINRNLLRFSLLWLYFLKGVFHAVTGTGDQHTMMKELHHSQWQTSLLIYCSISEQYFIVWMFCGLSLQQLKDIQIKFSDLKKLLLWDKISFFRPCWLRT